MLPGRPPACLVGLSQVEEMLIARTCSIMCVYRKHGGQRGYKGQYLTYLKIYKHFLTIYLAMLNNCLFLCYVALAN